MAMASSFVAMIILSLSLVAASVIYEMVSRVSKLLIIRLIVRRVKVEGCICEKKVELEAD